MVTKEAILKMVGDHDGKWGWYQIERKVNPQDLMPGTSAMGLIKELLLEGFIAQLPTEPMPYYALTEAGKARYAATAFDRS